MSGWTVYVVVTHKSTYQNIDIVVRYIFYGYLVGVIKIIYSNIIKLIIINNNYIYNNKIII